MDHLIDAIVQYDDLPPEQRAVFHEAIASNPDLAQLFTRWRQLHYEIGKTLTQAVPDRQALVLYALASRDARYLTAEETALVESVKEDLDAAIERHPALEDIIRNIVTASQDFTLIWNGHTRGSRSTTLPQTKRKFVLFEANHNPLLRLAATFLILVLAASSYFLVWRNQHVESIKTRAGEFRVIQLVDGSTVRLFEKSKLSFDKTTAEETFDRSVHLNGRAFFDIIPGDKPFVVETPTALTTAIGTRFSIDASRSLTEVVLTHGQVWVDSRQRSGHVVALAPGELSRVARRSPPTEPEPVPDLTNKLSWTGLTVFHNTPLRDVAAHFSQYFGRTLTIAPELAPEPIDATFDPDTLEIEELLETLSTTFGASYVPTGDRGFLLQRAD